LQDFLGIQQRLVWIQVFKLKYLKGTKDYSIYYNGKKVLKSYCNADFDDNENKRRSIIGYIFEINYSE